MKLKEETEAAVETAKEVLQEVVLVASLVRTLTNVFGSASDLYRTLKRKSDSKSQDGEDSGSTRPEARRRGSSSDTERPRRRSVRWNLANLRKNEYVDSEEESIYKSSVHIRAEYERGYQRLGEPFARGDLVVHVQLQSQIVRLQQTLLDIHQDLLLSTYPTPASNHSHLVRLIQTTRTARVASIEALNLQYQRLLPPRPPSRHGSIPGAFPTSADPPHEPHQGGQEYRPRRRDSCMSSSSGSEDHEVKILPIPEPKPKPKPKPKPTIPPPPAPQPNRLFCIYARDLQRNPELPLANSYKPGGNGMCPFCRSYIATRPGKAWEIIVDSHRRFDGYIKMISRTFLVKNRFVIKSHREGGGFACVLCARFRKSDTVCRQIEALMEHLWRDHTGEEMERDNDIVEC
ncbi:hypothetical protein IAQ61_009684 [Plenodomus lingam]|uniref:Predicted protein n=1 Tax=Leptosphaeria maculans (strain JN3 / isolate v23.1.3 / race Av1-4-5-6-7-8) TaxID=985895 RepID=E4ZT41_LEPMJ|nr:predicted protein [Plenodomus lingam JN3]KAH9863406.1 hypothetical protein IAQ61_009684 [Plenodomus lingam]CBX94472.1 predicted protein [Plenodomus lingam JN3]